MIKYDVVATLGTYQKDGETKYISRKVGAVIETKHGPSLKLDATFNPAGCVKGDDGGVWLKFFEPRDKQQQKQSAANGNGWDNSEIPF